MVPLKRYATVSGVPVAELLSASELDPLIQRARDAGVEVVKLLKSGSAFYAPASSVAEMLKAILQDEKRILPACVYVKGKYGLEGVFCGVPIRLGAGGVEEILEIPLDADEKKALHASANGVRQEMEEVDRLIGAVS